MKKSILSIIFISSLVFTGCEYDNFDEPKSILSGRIVYKEKPVGVRTNGIELELWQAGYALKTGIPVYVAHDGTYSVALFDGQYKLVRKAGAPWEPQLNDTIIIDVRKNTVADIPVKPYFDLRNESFQKGTGTITATFIVDRIVETAAIESVRLYLGKSILTDYNQKEHEHKADISSIIPGQEATITTQIPAGLAGYDYLFARIGIRATASNEFYYTQVQKINLK